MSQQIVMSATHLEQLVYENAGLIYHCEIEGAPVLEEREVNELALDLEVVVFGE